MSLSLALARAQQRWQQATRSSSLRPLAIALGLVALTLAALAVGTIFAQPRTAFTVGSADDARVLARFYSLERNESEVFRWSWPQAALFLYGFDGAPAVATLRLAAPRPADAPPAMLTVQSDAITVGTFPVATDWRSYHLLVPTQVAGSTALQLDSTPFDPAEGDARSLGVALNAVTIVPAAAPLGLPPFARTCFLLALPLLGWLLLWRLPVPKLLAAVVGVMLVGVTGWAAAAPNTSSYWLPTLGWPWWPVVPLALLVAAPTLFPHVAAGHRWLALRFPQAAWTGLGVALVAVAGLRIGLPVPLGLGLLLGGAAVAVTLLSPVVSAADPTTMPLRGRRYRGEAIALLAITALALALRLYNLDGQPLGLWRDESRHGMLALRIWQDPTFRPVYVVAGADLPALLFYLMAPFVGMFGPEAWSARMVSVLAGAFTPLALWWAARPLVGARAALLGAALIAWASWSLSMSRWAFPATLDHLLLLTAVGLMWRGLAEQKIGDRRQKTGRQSFPAPVKRSERTKPSTFAFLALSALCAGLAAYAYHTGRMAPIILAALTAVRLGTSWRAWRRALPALTMAVVVGLLTLAPLLTFIATNYNGYNRRVGMVSVFRSSSLAVREPLALLLDNAQRYLLMWHVQGERNGRHHAPGAPMLDPVTGLLFVLGLGLALRRWRSPTAVALLVWLALEFVPGLFSGDAPHAMRSLGTLAPACVLAGWGVAAVVDRIQIGMEQRTGSRGYGAGDTEQEIRSREQSGQKHERLRGLSLSKGQLGRSYAGLLLAVILAASLAFNTWLYFGQMAHNPLVYNEFDVVATAMGRVVQAGSVANITVFLPEEAAREDTIRYLTSGEKLNLFSPDALLFPATGDIVVLLPGNASEQEQRGILDALGPGSTVLAGTPTYPDSNAPIIVALGRGATAAQLVKGTMR